MRYVFDSNIVSGFLKRNPVLLKKVAHAEESRATFYLCPVVYYEVLRGLLYKDAKKQLAFFRRFCASQTRSAFTKRDWEIAAQWWGDLQGQGYQMADADLLIAAYAFQREAQLITNNVKHFANLEARGLVIVDWLQD